MTIDKEKIRATVLSLLDALDKAEKDAALVEYLVGLDDDSFLNLMSGSRMIPENFRAIVSEYMKGGE